MCLLFCLLCSFSLKQSTRLAKIGFIWHILSKRLISQVCMEFGQYAPALNTLIINRRSGFILRTTYHLHPFNFISIVISVTAFHEGCDASSYLADQVC